MEADNVVDQYTVCVKTNDVIVGHLSHGKNGRFTKMTFYFLRADKYAECKVMITGKEVNLGDGEGNASSALLVEDFWGKKYVTNTMYVKIFKINRNIAIYTFFQLLNQQSDALNSITLNALANSKAFCFIMTPSIGISWFLLSMNQLYIVLTTFS